MSVHHIMPPAEYLIHATAGYWAIAFVTVASLYIVARVLSR